MTRDISVLSGGVGAARFLRGLISAVDDPTGITAVVNTGDDCSVHGLSISPDIDTITYTLAGAIDPGRGWGLVDETWHAMGALSRYESVRPQGSAAGERWFGLGDQDLATHFYRTARLGEGASLTDVTNEIRTAWNVPIEIVPMTDDRLSTIVTIREADSALGPDTHREVSFQEYFVRLKHQIPVSAIRFDGQAGLSAAARAAILGAETIVVAPSNPLVSIGPIRSLDGVDELLEHRRESVVAVSPIVGGAALKGPADRMLTELGHEPTVVGVARLYAPIASALVVDTADAHLASAIEKLGMRCVVAPSVMFTPELAQSLALETLAAVQ
ncbi:MAG: 2-phospho-L-lactate transferase [Ilumatobacteraceae bacterium]|nr:2-phospho-L-lactate transferase [Ilumatobacteraceae bacterium]